MGAGSSHRSRRVASLPEERLSKFAARRLLSEIPLDFRALQLSRVLPEACVDGAHGVSDGGLLAVLLPVKLGPVFVCQPRPETRGNLRVKTRHASRPSNVVNGDTHAIDRRSAAFDARRRIGPGSTGAVTQTHSARAPFVQTTAHLTSRSMSAPTEKLRMLPSPGSATNTTVLSSTAQ